MRLTDQQIDSFRTPFFATLDKVDIARLADDRFRFLIRAPHALRWKRICGLPNVFVQADTARVLSFAESLTTFRLLSTTILDISFLPQLRCLTDLDLIVPSGDDDGAPSMPAEAILTALDCPLLTRLRLKAALRSKHITAVLSRCPLLMTLKLQSMAKMESLAFLSECTAAQRTLQSLSLEDCRHCSLDPRELFHLFSLRALTSLDLSNSLTEPLDHFGRVLFTPPSRAFPLLDEFLYDPPQPFKRLGGRLGGCITDHWGLQCWLRQAQHGQLAWRRGSERRRRRPERQ